MEKGWEKAAVVLMLLLALALAGCEKGERVAERPLPRLEITCPDPDRRARLSDGATYRDLAKSRAEALSGWRQCHDALSIDQE